jgi:hypothetical protein
MGGFTRSIVITFVSVALMVGSGFITGSFAGGTHDQSPPSLTVPVEPAFVIGNIVQRLPSCGDTEFTTNIGQSIKWSATDNHGVTSYDLLALLGGAPATLLLFSQETEYTDYVYGTDDNGDCGGGSFSLEGYSVTARDHNGNAVTRVVSSGDPTSCCLLIVTQEDGTSATGIAGRMSHSGAWTAATCDCLHGTAARSTTRRDWFTFTRTYDGGDRVALVMSRGPGRGVVGIRIDGRWLTNVDTYAPADVDRVVVFERAMKPGTHAITIVNHATRDRPEVVFDAVITN